MNEEEATVKTEPEDDEENGRTTPVRKSVQEYEQVCGNENAEVAGLTNDSLSNEGHNPATINDSENAIAPGNLEDVNSNDLATGVAVKDEPQDMDLADLEQTLARFDGQVNEHGETTPVQPQLEDSPPPAPPPPEIVALNTDTEIPVDKIKDELPDGEFTDMVEAQSSDNAIANVPKTTSPSKLTAVPMSRLRVKPEFSTLPPLLGGDEEQEEVCPPLPQDFFDGILTENAATRALIRPKDEPIPDDFFDDLLVDKVQERVEAAETQDLEVKFSDRLKTLRELERKERKMHKKSKKKSRKRQRSPSPSTSSRRRSSRSPSPPRRRHSRSPATSKRCRSRSLSPPRRRRSRSRSPIPRRRGSRSSPLTEQRNQKIMRWPEKSEFDDRISQMPTTSKRQHASAEFDLQMGEVRREQFKNEHPSRDNISPIKMIDNKSLRRHMPTADVQIHDDLVNGKSSHILPGTLIYLNYKNNLYIPQKIYNHICPNLLKN